MNAEIISIGDELLIGQVINTNASWIAEKITGIGISVCRVSTIRDKKEDIIDALKSANHHADIVLITGGLGPTRDDITKQCLCDFFETTLKFDEESYQNMVSILSSRDVIVNELNRKQAEVPANCKVIKNEEGTAPGMWFLKDHSVFISMPGVPFEMKTMLGKYIIPELEQTFALPIIIHKTLLLQGAAESKVAVMLESWEKELPENVTLAYLPSPGLLRLRITVTSNNRLHAGQLLEKYNKQLSSLTSNFLFGYDDDTLEEVVGKLLVAKNQTLSLAESCTGATLSQMITSVPGCSEYFKGAIIAYSNKVKIYDLQVDPSLILEHGAVSQFVTEAMVQGCLERFKTDYAIAVSGIAGPGGGTEIKPVGTIWITVGCHDAIISERFQFGDERKRNVTKAALTALNMLRKLILSR